MHISQTDRRYAANADTPQDAASALPPNPYGDATHLVRQGIGIQASLGTRSAVEFLKQNGVHGAVIHRVLMGEKVRGSDRMAPPDGLVIDDPRPA